MVDVDDMTNECVCLRLYSRFDTYIVRNENVGWLYYLEAKHGMLETVARFCGPVRAVLGIEGSKAIFDTVLSSCSRTYEYMHIQSLIVSLWSNPGSVRLIRVTVCLHRRAVLKPSTHSTRKSQR